MFLFFNFTKMNAFACGILLAILTIFILIYVQNNENFVVYMGPDGQKYIVLEKNSAKSAEYLAWINEKNIELMRYLRDTFPESEYTELLRKRYDPDVIGEHLPNTLAPETSYVQGKGDEVRFCLRGGARPTVDSAYADKNLLMFVNLHEMSHIASHEYGHGIAFWQTFKWLLTRAIEAGVYNPVNFAQIPQTYCGLDLGYNPYYDTSL